MDPISLIVLGYAGYKALTSKASTPTAAQQTAAAIEAAAQDLMTRGNAAMKEINDQLTKQGNALGFTFGGTGYPGGFTAYATMQGTVPYISADQVKSFSNLWNAAQHSWAASIKDGIISHDEAMAYIALARELAAMLVKFATDKQQYLAQMASAQKKTL